MERYIKENLGKNFEKKEKMGGGRLIFKRWGKKKRILPEILEHFSMFWVTVFLNTETSGKDMATDALHEVK